MPTTEEWIAAHRAALVIARREGDKAREAACIAELEFLGAPESAAKTTAPETATKPAAQPTVQD